MHPQSSAVKSEVRETIIGRERMGNGMRKIEEKPENSMNSIDYVGEEGIRYGLFCSQSEDYKWK
jgi:hypothetical protein